MNKSEKWTRRSIPGHLYEIHDADNNPVLRIRGGMMPCLEHMRMLEAAPEMLAALENARNVLAALAIGDLTGIKPDSAALLQVRAAIANATS